MHEKLFIVPSTLIPIPNPDTLELAESFYRHCQFCDKLYQVLPAYQFKQLNYCPFCIRHRHYTKNRHHILKLSFRHILGYFYQKYLFGTNFYLSELYDFLHTHIKIGLLNPLFYYDSETLLWFIDYSRVKKDGLPLSSLKTTIAEILSCFNLNETSLDIEQLQSLYENGLEEFYNYRHNRLLLPRIAGIDAKMCEFKKFEKKD